MKTKEKTAKARSNELNRGLPILPRTQHTRMMFFHDGIKVGIHDISCVMR